MTDLNIAGLAALTAVESLLVELVEREIITLKDKYALLGDAEQSHLNAAREGRNGDIHRAAAELLGRLREGQDGIQELWEEN